MIEPQKAAILDIAKKAEIREYHWPQRGKPAIGYYCGMSLSFARSYCKLKTGEAVAAEIAKADTGRPAVDALSHYQAQFEQLGMSNARAGPDTLRHVFVLLLGLGMRESSGKYCEGRDVSASNTSANAAEAGLFQCSYDLHSTHQLLDVIFAGYAGRTDFVDSFREGVTCSPASWRNWGAGRGRDFQQLTKACPAFAVEFAAVGLRNQRKHWGPINARAAELRPEGDLLFRQVQEYVEAQGITQV